MDRERGEFKVRGERLLPLLILAALILFHLLNNWIWLSTNVVIVGWDRPRHLIESLRYNDILKTLNYPSFFEAFTLSGYYPPLFHLLIVAFYKLFGLSADVAAMVNSLFLAVLLTSTYLIGRKVWGWREGLLAAFLLSTFPMIYAMSRYTYIEFALTAMVALGISLLLLSDGFTQRGGSLAFGLSLGFGLLTKWTYALFALPPLIWIVARQPLQRLLREVKPSLKVDRPFGSPWSGVSAPLVSTGKRTRGGTPPGSLAPSPLLFSPLRPHLSPKSRE
jgi:4-amino-4-deoxy-L-arabinose transferase-like glycosyltransferase